MAETRDPFDSTQAPEGPWSVDDVTAHEVREAVALYEARSAAQLASNQVQRLMRELRAAGRTYQADEVLSAYHALLEATRGL